MYDRIKHGDVGLDLLLSEFRRVDLEAAPLIRATRGGRELGGCLSPNRGTAGPGGGAVKRPKPTGTPRPPRTADASEAAPAAPASRATAHPAPRPAELESPSVEERAAASPTARFLLTAGPIAAGDVLSLLFSASLGLAAASVASVLSHSPASHAPAWPCVLVLLPLLIAYWQRGLYPAVALHPVVEARRIVELNTAACLCAAAALLASGAAGAWLAFLAIAWLASSALVPVGRALTRTLCARRAWWGYPTVVISHGAAAADTLAALRSRPRSGLRPCGVIDLSRVGLSQPGSAPAAGEEARADAWHEPTGSRHSGAAYAVVALPGYSGARLAAVLETYRSQFPYLLVASDLASGPGLWRDARDCGGGVAGTELLNKVRLPWPCFVKRATDLAVALAALALGLPMLAAIAVAVKLSSPGPIFFGQRRLGRGGRTFRAWKFRTMRCDADAVLRQLLETDPEARREWERDHKLRNDPRVTPIGELLRKTSLDELPQFWNVLVGEMSLVGPRPIVQAEVAKYGDAYRLYGQVRPGITGLWQVSGRSNTTYRRRVQLDEFYVRNWSPWLDAHLLLKTFRAVLRQEGAH